MGYLEEGLLLLKVLADHRSDVVRFTVGTQFVAPPAPVFLSLVLLLQALQHTANLPRQTFGLSHTVVFSWKTKHKPSQVLYLFRGLKKGHRGIDQLESILHLQHKLLPMRSHVLCTVPYQVGIIVVGLE